MTSVNRGGLFSLSVSWSINQLVSWSVSQSVNQPVTLISLLFDGSINFDLINQSNVYYHIHLEFTIKNIIENIPANSWEIVFLLLILGFNLLEIYLSIFIMVIEYMCKYRNIMWKTRAALCIIQKLDTKTATSVHLLCTDF